MSAHDVSCGSHKLGQSDDEMERQSKMVGGVQRLEKLGKNLGKK